MLTGWCCALYRAAMLVLPRWRRQPDSYASSPTPSPPPTDTHHHHPPLLPPPQVLRTPIVRGTSPLWNWQLDLKLPGPLGEGLYDEVARLTVYDVHTLGDPVVVGSAEVRRWRGECVMGAGDAAWSCWAQCQ